MVPVLYCMLSEVDLVPSRAPHMSTMRMRSTYLPNPKRALARFGLKDS